MTGKYIKTDLDIRHYIYSFFTDTSRPPDKIETALHFRTSIEEVELAFHRLAQDHQIVLAPGTSSIWMAHPFSGLPTEHIAEIDSKKFWGNWAWDIFGIAAVLKRDAIVRTPCGCRDCDYRLEIPIKQNKPVKSDWLVHFVVPARHFWQDIGYTWATILAFSSEAHLDSWLTHRGLDSGYIMSIQTCHELAQFWYKGRAERNWQRHDQKRAEEIFKQVGLGGDFWELSDPDQ